MGCTKALGDRILVTGGAGFIGSHVVDALLDRGDDIVVFDNFHDYYDPKRKVANIAQNINNPSFNLVVGNIYDQPTLEHAFQMFPRINKIVHLAARAGVRASEEDPHGYALTNVLGTRVVLNMAREHMVENVVFASSSSVYGDTTKLPFSESDHLGKPLSPYAETKQKGEELCQKFSREDGVSVTCLRFFTVYGPRGRPDMAPYLFTDKIFTGAPILMYGEGTSTRDYTYVSDIVYGILAALDMPRPFEIFNLGNNTSVPLEELIRAIEDIVGKKANIVQTERAHSDVEHTCADISKAQTILGYAPRTPLRSGLENFFAWYKNFVVYDEKLRNSPKSI